MGAIGVMGTTIVSQLFITNTSRNSRKERTMSKNIEKVNLHEAQVQVQLKQQNVQENV